MGMEPPSQMPRAGQWLLDETHRDELADRLIEFLVAHHSRDPLADGIPTEAARQALDLPDPALLTLVLKAPAAAEISWHDGRLRLSTALPESLRIALRKVQSDLRKQPFNAPTAAELAQLGLSEKELAAAARAGELLRIARGLVLLPDAELDALERLSKLSSPFTLSQAKQALRTTRRVAVPLLERLARQGYTQRLEDGRHRLR
jgi:selenocysteine-specific elongation factor